MLLLLLYADTHRTAQRSPQKAEGIHTDLRENVVVHHREGETPCRPLPQRKSGMLYRNFLYRYCERGGRVGRGDDDPDAFL